MTTLHVFTGRMGIRDPDHLDITLQGNLRRTEPHRGIGIYFAPSPELLYPFMGKRKFRGVTDEDFKRYAGMYTAEMRESFRAFRLAWNLLLTWERVVLLCFCNDHVQCHRTVLGRDILPKLGAKYEGEIGP